MTTTMYVNLNLRLSILSEFDLAYQIKTMIRNPYSAQAVGTPVLVDNSKLTVEQLAALI